ncbi:MAG: methyltransferase domain-containing protein [Deltaproteobacteria bacterium]|nr:methyltransferase domain-containing protein [Deltaproteobacteria bacterium]
MAEQIEKYFDDYFQKKPDIRYEFDIRGMGRKDRRIVRTLREFGVSGKRCLDIGPGTGRWVQFLKKEGAGYLAAVDISPVSLERCAPFCDAVQQVNIEREKLPWDSESFDAVLFFEIIEHLVDCTNAIAEVMRVLKPGGLLLLSTPNLVSFISRLRMVLGMLPVAIAGDSTHVRFYRRQELAAAFAGYPARLAFLSTSFSLHPLKPKSHLRCPSFGWLTALDDSLLLCVRKDGD